MATPNASYISVREAAQLLGVSEKKIMDFIERKELQCYRIAGQFLRLKKSEVLSLRKTGNVVNEAVRFPYTPRERLRDFLVYNDFYIVCGGLIVFLLVVILKG